MASTSPRIGTAAKEDTTGRVITLGYSNPAYAATLVIKPNAKEYTSVIQALTGALALSVDTTRAFAADILTVLFLSDATGRTITFGAGFAVSAATLALTASKKGSITFMFDGVHYVEQGRCVGI